MPMFDDDVFERRTLDGRVIGLTMSNVSQHDRDKLSLPLLVSAERLFDTGS